MRSKIPDNAAHALQYAETLENDNVIQYNKVLLYLSNRFPTQVVQIHVVQLFADTISLWKIFTDQLSTGTCTCTETQLLA